MQSEQQEKSCSLRLQDQDSQAELFQKQAPDEFLSNSNSSSSENKVESGSNAFKAQFQIDSPDKSLKASKSSHTDKKSKNAPNLRNSKYQKISDDIRSQILFRCMIMHQPLRQTSKQLGINFSSAKNVIQVYKKEGRLNKKTSRLKRTSSGELVDRMGDINGEALEELKKKICPVKIELASITHDDIKVVRNQQIYVPLSGGKSSYECIKLSGIERPLYLQSLNQNDFESIFQQAKKDLPQKNEIFGNQGAVIF